MSQDKQKLPQTAIDQIANEGHLKLLKAAIPYTVQQSEKPGHLYKASGTWQYHTFF